ncbi:MAG: hypothetical protein P8Z37_15005 [Acidobacteriota bacterium]
MARTEPPLPVKYFIAVLYREEEQALEAKNRLVSRWGAIDFEGSDHPFDVTELRQPWRTRETERSISTPGIWTTINFYLHPPKKRGRRYISTGESTQTFQAVSKQANTVLLSGRFPISRTVDTMQNCWL